MGTKEMKDLEFDLIGLSLKRLFSLGLSTDDILNGIHKQVHEFYTGLTQEQLFENQQRDMARGRNNGNK
jgi:hypothetical protein